jgi:hypothetical protein
VSLHGRRFNPPPGWPPVPSGWTPPAGWAPPPEWPSPPEGWQFWVDEIDQLEPTAESFTAEDRASNGDGGSQVDESHVSLEHRNEEPPRDEGQYPSTAEIVQQLEVENASLREELAAAGTRDEPGVPLDDQQILQEVGIYRYHHPLENSVSYQARLLDLERRVASILRDGQAIEKSNLFTFDNSLAKGRKMSDDLAKLMLRAYNAEVDIGIRTLKAGNVQTAKKRLESSRQAIARLGAIMQMRISEEFHELRIEELELTADWLMKKQEEKEAEREERARLREEKRVEKELAEERARLDKERTLLVQTLEKLGADDPNLVERIAAIDQAIAENDYRAANIRAGYVYVISNRGAFGEGVVKIGLTRRLEPKDRVHELGGASVPFRFDIHTIYFSEDAVTLELELHRHFANRALNQANPRKEFFFASPSEVREVLASKVGNLLEFSEQAEATEFFQSLSRWPNDRQLTDQQA